MLIVSIPLLTITIYSAWQTNHLLRKHSADSIQPYTAQSHLQWPHSVYPNKIAPSELKVQIGNDQCSQPYNACILNVGGTEDTNLKRTFIQARKEKEADPYEYSVTEGLNTYHLAAGGLVWQIGSDYLGCRTEYGHFNSKTFTNTACRPEVKMIELKLSSAKKSIDAIDSFSGHVEPIEGKIDTSFLSDSAFTTFRNAEGMIHFLNNLRELCGGKPIGIRLCTNDKKGFYQICHAIRKAQLIPDFIVIEGYRERTGTVQLNESFYTGTPLYEALLFVSQTLKMYGLENKIKVVAHGQIFSSFEILKVLALGADLICTEMPRYTSRKYPVDGGELSDHFKIRNEYDFHDRLMQNTIQLMSVCGFKSVSDITLSKFFNRLDLLHSKNVKELNGPVLYPATVMKSYRSRIKTHRPLEKRGKWAFRNSSSLASITHVIKEP